jgi:LysR family transcriptional regulator, glycine cleavage system transcriptional activator
MDVEVYAMICRAVICHQLAGPSGAGGGGSAGHRDGGGAELNLTPGAISRALQEVEGQLGVALLIRDRQRLAADACGAGLCGGGAAGAGPAGAGGAAVAGGGRGESLTLAILPAFGMHWLAPRLRGFRAREPGIALTLTTRLRPFDIEAEGFDAAIHYGRADWPGAEHLLLMEEEVLAVCAPGAFLPLAGVEALLDLPLAADRKPDGGLGRWFAGQGMAGVRPGGMLFDQFATMHQAAVHGLGWRCCPPF